MNSQKRGSVSSKQSKVSIQSSSCSNPGTSKPMKPPRRVLQSNKLTTNPPNDGKSCSTGGIKDKKPERQKKVTRSDFVIEKQVRGDAVDFCKKCGDTACNEGSKINHIDRSDVETLVSMPRKQKINHIGTSSDVETLVSMPKKPKVRVNGQLVQQFYRNENFHRTAESIIDITNGVKKISLDPIKEVSEIRSQETLFKICDSEEDLTNIDINDSLSDIKEFRQKNYFECHSSNSRIKNRVSATSLQGHKCVYRFYLNDRLFPVPLCTDHNNEIRCIECLLPMNLQIGSKDQINGTIQAKVTLGKENQDVMILLPIKEPLIIHEKRKESQVNKDTIYFGLINLDNWGNSVFNPTLPGDSLALKYQKGYKEFQKTEEYGYNDLDKNDVIVI